MIPVRQAISSHFRRYGPQGLALALVAAAVLVLVFWFFGASLWQALILGCAVTVVGVAGLIGTSVEVRDLHWRPQWRGYSEGSRRDVSSLSLSLHGGARGRVGMVAQQRVRRLVRYRLALRGLDINDPGDRGRAEQLVGSTAYLFGASSEHRRGASLRALTQTLDALDALEAREELERAGQHPAPSTVLARRWTVRQMFQRRPRAK